jgi:uncharacterized protein (TIGR02246 family)
VRMRGLALLLLGVALVPACAERSTPSAVEGLAAGAAIDSLWTGYARASDRKDADGFGALFTEDATLVTSNAPTAQGREAIQKFLVSRYADIDPTGLRVEPDETRIAEGIAIQSGTFEERFLDKGRGRAEYGRFVLIAEQGKDHAWKIRRLVAIADSTR